MNICIIIPAYNEENYLAYTLQSLVSQTHQIKEIIVVNDNSTDNTQSIIDSFLEKYPYIQSIKTKSVVASLTPVCTASAKPLFTA